MNTPGHSTHQYPIRIKDVTAGRILSYKLVSNSFENVYQLVISEVISVTTSNDRASERKAHFNCGIDSKIFVRPEYCNASMYAFDADTLEKCYIDIEIFKKSGNIYITKKSYLEFPNIVTTRLLSGDHEANIVFDMQII